MKRVFAALLAALLLSGCARAGAGTPEPAEPQSAGPGLIAMTAEPPTESMEFAPDTLYALFVNVGYGDAAILRYRNRAMLIDTGAKAAVPRLLAALNALGIESLDAVVLTHTHADHIGGMEAVARNLPVERVYAASISENKKKGGNRIAELCEELNLPLTRLDAGDTLPFAEGAEVEALGPLVYNADDDNDNSLVLRLGVNGRKILFVGDMQFAEENTLLAAGTDLAAEVLKVGNHGNPDATGDAFGRAVSPLAAVISTDTLEDKNSANPRVLAALEGAEPYITQDYPIGVLLSVDAAGELMFSSPARVKSGAALALKLDTGAQMATLTNAGAGEADLSGFILLAERGGHCFRFPAGARLAAGASLHVGAPGAGADYAFAGAGSPWNRKKGDAALLYDAGGSPMARAEADPAA